MTRTHIEAILLALTLAVAVNSCSSSRSRSESRTEAAPQKTAAVKGDTAIIPDQGRPDLGMPGEASYLCIKGDYQSKEPTVCPIHKMELLREGTYFCPTNDGVFSDRPGKCPKCGRELEQVDMKE